MALHVDGRAHSAHPQFVEMFSRYQCQHCHSWITYDESFGKWFHLGRLHEEMKAWSWDGSSWTNAEI